MQVVLLTCTLFSGNKRWGTLSQLHLFSHFFTPYLRCKWVFRDFQNGTMVRNALNLHKIDIINPPKWRQNGEKVHRIWVSQTDPKCLLPKGFTLSVLVDIIIFKRNYLAEHHWKSLKLLWVSPKNSKLRPFVSPETLWTRFSKIKIKHVSHLKINLFWSTFCDKILNSPC